MEVQDGVYTYDIDWEMASDPLSVHVVEAEGATLLFGGGDDELVSDLATIVEDHDVDIVVVEHGDSDHFGGVPGLLDRFELEVAVPGGDADVLVEEGIDPDYRLDGDTEYWGVQTISAPGHTPDNMSYMFEDILIAGDTVSGSDSDFASSDVHTDELSIITADWNWDDEKTRESVSNLLEYEFDTILVSHGSNVEQNGPEAVEELVSKFE